MLTDEQDNSLKVIDDLQTHKTHQSDKRARYQVPAFSVGEAPFSKFCFSQAVDTVSGCTMGSMSARSQTRLEREIARESPKMTV